MPSKIDIEFLRDQIIGNSYCFQTPFGKRLLTYADYTASGRSLKFIENYLIKIQAYYANTHTEDDASGRSMTRLLHLAEASIKRNLKASENCYLIPVGTGATGAIGRLQQILGVYIPPATRARLTKIVETVRVTNPTSAEVLAELETEYRFNMPVVFIGPYEHHSNDISWREGYAEVVEIDLQADGQIDLHDLETKLQSPQYQNRMKIGSFSAASNVTGIISPVYEIARILHRHDTLACFDFAASAPYVDIDMNRDEECYFDAVFISPHKFIGGPGSSGLLVVNKRVYNPDLSPTHPAGGTVRYVSAQGYDFHLDPEERERAGTPGILQVLKASLALEIKSEIGVDQIEAKEKLFTQQAVQRLEKNPNIQILGNPHAPERIGIFSIMIRHGEKYLHSRFATSLLNDLFGIQTRAGCVCAAPYGHRLLGISPEKSDQLRQVISRGIECVKPGWLRFNFHFVFSQDDFEFICNAVEFVADFGYLFLPEYNLNFASGGWLHNSIDKDDDYLNAEFGVSQALHEKLGDCFHENPLHRRQEYDHYFAVAKAQVKALMSAPIPQYGKLNDPEAEALRWFEFVEGE